MNIMFEELELARELAETELDAYDEIAPGTQQTEGDTAEDAPLESETFVYFNPDRATEHRQYDIGIEIGFLFLHHRLLQMKSYYQTHNIGNCYDV